MENLDDELLDEELSDFFKDEDSKEEQKKEEDAELANQKVVELLDTFNVKKNFNEIVTIKDAKDFIAMTDKVKANLSSLESVYGADVANKLEEVLAMEGLIQAQLKAFFEFREGLAAKFKMVRDATEHNEMPPEFRQSVEAYIAAHPLLDTVTLYYALSNMIDRRKEQMDDAEGSGAGFGGDEEEEEYSVGEIVAAAAGYAAGKKVGEEVGHFINAADKEEYLKDFFNKIKIIEQATGLTLDDEFKKFFTSDEYITSSNLTLPELLRDENYDKLKDIWSLPEMVEDLRVEEANRELFAADDSIKSLENHFAVNYGNTQDNSVIETLKGLSGDVQEEKQRIEQDIEFLKKEKLKERVEVAILATVSGLTQNKKIDTLANLLKETITSRINYMKDENNLRDMRKNLIQDKSNKDNERNSADYFEALQGVNMAINKRREERAEGKVAFKPKILIAKQELKKDQMDLEIGSDERSINDQNLSMGGRQKVLTYVNRFNSNNNINAA